MRMAACFKRKKPTKQRKQERKEKANKGKQRRKGMISQINSILNE